MLSGIFQEIGRTEVSANMNISAQRNISKAPLDRQKFSTLSSYSTSYYLLSGSRIFAVNHEWMFWAPSVYNAWYKQSATSCDWKGF